MSRFKAFCVALSTVNGPVKASFSELKKSASLKSVHGSVTAALPSEINADVSASTVNGGIRIDRSKTGALDNR
jgi:DUF4097 and DUF4098 domain-containing protein YvlB